MKKLLTLALATVALGVSAEDFVVYNDGVLAAGLNVYGWWAAGMDFAAENPTDATEKVYSFKADNGGAAASMGILLNGQDFMTGPLNSATLNFKWYATTPAKYTVRVTADGGTEQDYSWEVSTTDIKKWNEVSLPVATTFPTVSQEWKDFVGKGSGYVFSIILDNGLPTSEIFLSDIRYTGLDESWVAPEIPEIVPPTTVPEISTLKDDILSVLSTYGKAAFNFGSWGQSTQTEFVIIDGVEVLKMTLFNYLGFELNPSLDVSGYKYMHVDFYPCEETTFGFTPISPGKEQVWEAPEVKLNEWNSYDVLLSKFPIELDDVFQIKFDLGKKVECYLANVYFWKEDQGDLPPVKAGATWYGVDKGTVVQPADGVDKEYPYTLSYNVVYNEDKTLTVNAEYIFTDGEPFGIVEGSFMVDNGLWNQFTMDGKVRTATTTETFEPNELVNIKFFIAGGAGVILEDHFAYTVGSENDPVGVSAVNAAVGEATYYTMQGIRVERPAKGLHIVVRNGKAQKILF